MHRWAAREFNVTPHPAFAAAVAASDAFERDGEVYATEQTWRRLFNVFFRLQRQVPLLRLIANALFRLTAIAPVVVTLRPTTLRPVADLLVDDLIEAPGAPPRSPVTLLPA
jgi:hypothetical protein